MGRLSTVDLLIKIACFETKVNNSFITKVAGLSLYKDVNGIEPFLQLGFTAVLQNKLVRSSLENSSIQILSFRVKQPKVRKSERLRL
jgi:hypothetical protein